MSASVFKPICLPLMKFRASLPEKKYSNCARRILFGPIDHVETQQFLDREFEKQAVDNSNKWAFDFRNGVPLNIQGGRFIWKPVIQSPDKLTYAPKRRRSIDQDDNSALYPQPLTEDERPQANPLRSCIIVQQPTVDVNSNKKQCKITDFMQARKRPADSAFKKILSAPRPSKISKETTPNS